MPALIDSLSYKPVELKVGTSGRRGEVVHLTQLEVYLNSLAELEYLQSLAPADGGIPCGDEFYFACDLRPSSPAMALAIARAVENAGLRPVYLGRIPTPSLAFYSWSRTRGSIMVTGSSRRRSKGWITPTARVSSFEAEWSSTSVLRATPTRCACTRSPVRRLARTHL